MTLRDKHIAGRDRFAVALHELILAVQSGAGSIVWVFEGKDDVKYYGFRIRHCLGREVTPWVNSRGRGNLRRLIDRVKTDATFRTRTIGFFLDRDYAYPPLPNDPNIYVTPCYSIENLYVTPSALARILQEEFGLGTAPGQTECAELTKRYAGWLANFANFALLTCAWLSLQQRRCAEAGRDAPTLPENAFSLLFDVAIEGGEVTVAMQVPLSDMQRVCLDSLPQTVAEVQEEGRLLLAQGLDVPALVRGKFLVEFFRLVLLALMEDANTDPGSDGRYRAWRFHERHPTRLAVSKPNILSELSRFADTPDCLTAFLKRIAARSPAI